MDLRGKIILITGSSTGIGRETAFKFAKEGCSLVITYCKDKEDALKAAEACARLGASDILVVQLNLMDSESIRDCVKKAAEKFKKIDILVNNAGVLVWGPLKEQTFEEIEMQSRTNLEGLIKMTKECLPYLKEMIINIASGAGKSAYSGLSVYCATKFGVRGFTQSLAQELKIKAYSVNPGMTATRMTNFQGASPEKVAQVVLDTAKGKHKYRSGADIDVWDFI